MKDDLIRRQDAIDMFQQLAYDDWNQGVSTSWADAYAECAEMLRDLPSAEPERKKGKWIDAWRSAMDGTRHWHRECSECGYERDDDNIDKDTRFCPNCGAEMEGEEKDE